MVSHGVRRFLVAYAAGSLCGLLAYALETLPRGIAPLVTPAAAYGFTAGLLASLGRMILGWILSPRAARAGVLIVIGVFLSLHLLYFANVRILPGDPYSSAKSVALDMVVLVVIVGPLLWISRSPWAQDTRYRFDGPTALLGGVLLTVNVLFLTGEWPRTPPESRRAGPGPNLLLVVVDSVRHDHLGLYGYRRPTSPSLDALAPRARVFEAAYSASSWTVPSVLQVLHSRLENGTHPVAGLAERLAKRGYLTACFSDNPHLARGSHIMEGFDYVERSVGAWRWMFRGTLLGEVIERIDGGSDRPLVDWALTWVQQAPGPVFLYMHLMDSHTPYNKPLIDGQRGRGRRIEFPFTGMAMTAEEAEDIVARYDGGIRSADAQVGRLVTAAGSWGRPFLAIVTADHGESLGESGRWFHGGSLAPELLHIPLLVIGKGVRPGRVAADVAYSSITKTLLTAGGVACADIRGSDLRASEGDGFAEGGLPPNLSYRVMGGYKVVYDRRSGRRQLFDVRNDVLELHDVQKERPNLALALSKGLERPGEEARPMAEEIERLRSLGYAGY